MPAAPPLTPLAASRLEAFRARYPGMDVRSRDPVTGLPTEILGSGVRLAAGNLSAASVLELGHRFVEENADFLGVSGLETRGEPRLAGTTWILNFGLEKEGVPIEAASRVDLRFKTHGVLAAILTSRIPSTFASPATPEDDGASRVSAVLDAARSLGAENLSARPPSLEFLVGDDGIARLSWRVLVEGVLDEAPYAHESWIAARGEPRVLRDEDRVYRTDVLGNVKGRGHLFDPRSALVELPLSNLEVRVVESGNTALTGANGDFAVPNDGETPVTVHAELRGPWVDVNDTLGNDLVLDVAATPGTPVALLFHPTPPQGNPLEWSQVNGFFHTVLVHDYLRGILDLPEIDVPLPCNVNTSGSCNAFYSQGTINFNGEGSGCVNMAFDTVIYHEYGHFLDDVLGTIVDRALSEAIGDVLASYASNQPLIGEQYRVNQYMRTVDNDRKWPALECTSDIYCKSEAFSGFAWHLREKLIHSLGPEVGKAVAETIVLNSFVGNAINIPRAVLEVFLQDDDDGDLGNGTPHFTQIAKAAVLHGFDPPLLPVIAFEHQEMPFATVDTVNDLPIRAKIRPAAGPLTEATLVYSLNDGSFVETTMVPGSETDEWVGWIPAQPCGTWIKYYLRAADRFGNARLAPPGAPGNIRREVFSFHIGRSEAVFFDDFESGAPGWTHSAATGEDDWELGPPNPLGLNAYDPLVAYSGSNVWGNDLSADGNYPDNTDSILKAPVLDASAYAEVWAKFHYWISIERGTRDVAKFKVENAVPFQFDLSSGTVSEAWMSFETEITPFTTGNPELDLAFALTTNATYTAGGWNIDNLEVQSLTCDIVSLELDRRFVHPGDPVLVTLRGAPGETAYVLFDHGYGGASWQVPGGPLLYTGLTEGQRLRDQAVLDGNGVRQANLTFPTNPNLVGKHYVVVAVSRNAVWQISNYFEFDVVP